MKTVLKLILITLTFCLFPESSSAQTCSGCTYSITQRDTNSYTINTGQTFCIDSAGKFSGNIVINGGTICNRGLFIPKTISFQTGTIDNFAAVVFNENISLGSACVFNNNAKSASRFKKSLIIVGALITNQGIITVGEQISITSGSVVNSGITNCRGVSGTSTLITNTGILNKN